MSGMELLQA